MLTSSEPAVWLSPRSRRPPEQAARIAVETILATPAEVEIVRLVAFDEETRDLLVAALTKGLAKG
jgi:hypothetical protein